MHINYIDKIKPIIKSGYMNNTVPGVVDRLWTKDMMKKIVKTNATGDSYFYDIFSYDWFIEFF